MATSSHRGANLFSALGSRKGARKDRDEVEVDGPPPKDDATGAATSTDAAIAIHSSWANADTWEGDGEDLGELPEGWVQEEDIHEEVVEEVAPETVDRKALAELAVYEAERAHGIDDMLMSDGDESQEEELNEEGSESHGPANGTEPDVASEAKHKEGENDVKPKGTEKTLSKKELKAKEMEELDRIFEEMGIQVEDKESEDQPSSKSKKKKKKKADRAAAANNTNDAQAPVAPTPAPEEARGQPAVVEEAAASNGKAFARPKPGGASGKKKHPGKQVSAAAKAAAEAKARASKMAKKKDPSKFNQLPTR